MTPRRIAGAMPRFSGHVWKSPFLVAAVILSVAPLYLVNLNGWLTEDDEGAYVYTAWRMAEGEALYSDVSTTKPPVSLLAAAAVFRTVGPDLGAARALGLVAVAAAGLALFFAGRRLGGPACGLVAPLLLLLHPDVIRSGRFFRPDSFLLAAAGATYLALLVGIERRRGIWFAGAGALGTIAILSKLSGALVLVAVALGVLIVRRDEPRPRARVALLAGTLGALAVAAGLLWLAAPDFLTQTVGHQMRQTGDYTFFRRAEHGFRYTLTRILHSYPVTVPAIVLAVIAVRRRPSLFAERVLAAIFPTMLLMLFVGRELYARHFLVYLPAVSLLSARALTWPGGRRLRRLQALGFVVLVAWIGYGLYGVVLRIACTEGETLTLAERVRELTGPDDFVFGDYAEINFHARRRGTPQTPRLSRGAIESGEITTDGLIRDLEASEVKLVFVRVGTDDTRRNREGVNPSPHLLSLPDFDRLIEHLDAEFRRVEERHRGPQVFRIYVRP